jgi:hypothetical protein
MGIALAVIAVGLGLHELGFGLPARARDFIGDALWGIMIFAWLGVLWPGSALRLRAGLALAVCWTIEVSQAYHTPHLDAARHTRLGALVLGTGFDWRDLAAYALGVAAIAALESERRRRTHTTAP